MTPIRYLAVATAVCGVAVTAAQGGVGDGFVDAKDNAKVHTASGFVCPGKIDLFERDAVGRKDSETGADFCAYSALDGTYGTVTLTPLTGAYDPKVAMARDFKEQEGIGSQKGGEGILKTDSLPVYFRSYETSKLESLHYRIQFTGAVVGNWAVETTIEYADPRDNAAEKAFLDTIYTEAAKQIAKPMTAPTPVPGPVKGP